MPFLESYIDVLLPILILVCSTVYLCRLELGIPRASKSHAMGSALLHSVCFLKSSPSFLFLLLDASPLGPTNPSCQASGMLCL